MKNTKIFLLNIILFIAFTIQLHSLSNHNKIFQKGVKAWNKWRLNHPNIVPRLIKMTLKDKTFSNANFNNCIIIDTVIKNCVFKNCGFTNSKLYNVKLENVKIVGSMFLNTIFRNVKAIKTSIKESKLLKLKIIKTAFYFVIFKDLQIIETSFVVFDCSRFQIENSKIYKSIFKHFYVHHFKIKSSYVNNCIFNCFGGMFFGINNSIIKNTKFLNETQQGISSKNFINESVWNKNQFIRTSFKGFLFKKSYLLNNRFMYSKFTNISFWIVKIKDSRFTKTQLYKLNIVTKRNDWSPTVIDKKLYLYFKKQNITNFDKIKWQ